MLRRQLVSSMTNQLSTSMESTTSSHMSLSDFRSLRTTEDSVRMSEVESLGKTFLQLKETHSDLPPIETLEDVS